jgi:hypothetical protein
MNKPVILSMLVGVPMLLSGAATISIVNGDPAGEGFNDPTPAAPVGGNAGTTLGQQRQIVFQRAAEIWGAVITSSVEIKVFASWPSLSCNANAAVLGAAGATTVHANFPGAPVQGVWYPQALANKLSGADRQSVFEDIDAVFNKDVGQPGCLTGRFFYLGIDGNAPTNTVNFLTTLLHELGHGLGFQTFTDESTGEFLAGLPSVADLFLLDKLSNQTWATMSSFMRAVSAVNGQGKLVWDGANVKASVPAVLTPAPLIHVTAPASVATTYLGGPSTMGPPVATPVSGELMPVTSNAGGGNACAPLTGFDAEAVNGKVALIDRGACGIDVKMLNAQNAGAKAVVLVNNTPDIPPPNITVFNASVTIPNVMVSNADGNTLKNSLRFRSRTNSGMFVTLNQGSTRAGADNANRAIMYAPADLSGGSSVSHFDVSAARNLLMEPFINVDLTLSVAPPQDLTLPFLRDLGW